MVDSQRNVHWALDISISDFGSPSSDTSSVNSTSSFQYINSQLVAHGFTSSPGISLEGISNDDMDRIAKCLLAMLSQRVSDMSQADELSTKLRTLSYDHERLMTMHRSATEKALNAEREVNMYKSRLATANRSLQSAESSHKQTMAELQRTRTSIQALRLTHATELKKREKEIERMVEKWTKLSDSQAKASAPSPGMVIRGANAEVVSGSETHGKGKGFLEVALEHAESSRTELLDETTRLRRLVLVCANRLQTMLHEIRTLASLKAEEPTPFDHDALFPITPITAADDKMLSLFASANDAVSVLAKHLSDKPTTQSTSSGHSVPPDSAECKRLQAAIDKLQVELDEAKKLQEAQAAENCALLDRVAAQAMQKASTESNIEALMTERDAERDRLDRNKKQLEDERQKFTQAAVKLGKEKVLFESERIKFLEEKRSWQVQQMLSPTHDPPGSPSIAAYLPEVKKSPRKSPRKQKVVGKSSSSRKTRVSRRSSLFSIPPPTNVEPSYETEVIPIVVPASKRETKNPVGLTKSILPTSFVLPPPSPRTSLPPPPDTLLGPIDDATLDSDSDVAASFTPTPTEAPFLTPIPTIIEPPPVAKPAPVVVGVVEAPRTPPPMRRPFPMAKPLASHMTHAYSPVKPSPLSRILMLADSPESPEPEPTPVPQTENDPTEDRTPTEPQVPVIGTKAPRNDDDDDDSPLREKKTARNAGQVKGSTQVDAKKRTSREKRHTKEEPTVPAATSKPKTIRAGEKENRDKPARRGSPPVVGATSSNPSNPPVASKPEVPARGTTKVPAKLPAGRGGGARRVPIGSAEAAPLPGWRG